MHFVAGPRGDGGDRREVPLEAGSRYSRGSRMRGESGDDGGQVARHAGDGDAA